MRHDRCVPSSRLRAAAQRGEKLGPAAVIVPVVRPQNSRTMDDGIEQHCTAEPGENDSKNANPQRTVYSAIGSRSCTSPAAENDGEWVLAQEKTFRNWINEQLRHAGHAAAHDLAHDLGDGILLPRLLRALRGGGNRGYPRLPPSPPPGFTTPDHTDNYHRRLASINQCLQAMRDDNIKLVNIGAEDILGGNLKLILGLVWHLILRYHIGKDSGPPKFLMLQWLSGVMPDCTVTNFTRDWSDGRLLHALLNFCRPELSHDWRNLDPADRLDNCKVALSLAHKELGIPQLLSADDLAKSALDELSVMTYISYFMKPNSAGYRATLKRINCINDHASVQNFTADWTDGVALCTLVHSVGGKVRGWPDLPINHPMQCIQLGLDAASSLLGEQPTVTAEQMATPGDNYLATMAYVATFMRLGVAVAKLRHCLNDSSFKHKRFVLSSVTAKKQLNASDLTNQVVDSTKVTSSDSLSSVYRSELVVWCQSPKAEEAVAGKSLGPSKESDQLLAAMIDQPSISRATGNPVGVYGIRPLSLDQRNSFIVDASEAGNGALNLTIGSNGSNLPHSVRELGDHRYEVSFIPHDCVDHFIGVHFNGCHVPGSPFMIRAPEADLSGVTITGDGHKTAKIGLQAQFTVKCTSTRVTLPLRVSVRGPNGQQTPVHVIDNRNLVFNVEWTPICGGDHIISVTYGDQHIPASPFTVKVTNPQAVIVTSPQTALKGRSVEYKVDVSDAGSGTLEYSILCNGQAIPNSVQPRGPGAYLLSFTPYASGPHRVSIQLDGQHVPGSPFLLSVTGGSQFVTIKEQSTYHQVGRPASIQIEAVNAGEGQIVVEVCSPTNGIENELRPAGNKTYELSFVPVEPGIHSVIVSFNGQQVPQSPYKFMVQPATVLNDYSSASDLHGVGTLHGPIRTTKGFHQSRSSPQLLPNPAVTPVHLPVYNSPVTSLFHRERNESVFTKAAPSLPAHEPQLPSLAQPYQPGQAAVQPSSPYRPAAQEESTMLSRSTYREAVGYQTLPPVINGRSLDTVRYDSGTTQDGRGASNKRQNSTVPRVVHEESRTVTYAPQARAMVTNEPSYFELNSHGHPINDLEIKITDPMNVGVPFEVMKLNDKHRITFIPQRLGTYLVHIAIDGVPMPGSPYSYFVQHHGGVKLYNIPERGYVGQELDFTVDHSVVDSDDVAVEVSAHGTRIPTRQHNIGNKITRYAFIPEVPGDHCIDISVNYVAIAGSPFTIAVTEPSQTASLHYNSDTMRSEIPMVIADVGKGLASFAVSEKNYFILEMRGRHWSLPDMHVDVRAPNGEIIAASLLPRGNNEVKVEYQSPYVGRHYVDIFYKGRKLPGCPYYVEVFDPKKVSLHHMPSESVVQEQTEFEVVTEEAGRADMECRVISPSGLLIPCQIANTPRGMTVNYTPVEPGTYYVHTFIGGVEIPGSPMTQTVYETQATLTRRQQAALNTTATRDVDLPAVDSLTIRKHKTTHTSSTLDEGRSTSATPATASSTAEQHASSSLHQRSRRRERHEESNDRTHHDSRLKASEKIRDRSSDGGRLGLLTVYGAGLCCGEVDREAVFYIDTHGMHGTPVILVEGPNSMAKVHIDPHGSNTFKVTYVPVEVGRYDVHVTWLNKEIDGSPFKALVVDPRKVHVQGGWLNLLDAQGRLPLVVNELKRIQLKMADAGPGKLKAEVKHVASSRAVPVFIDEKSRQEYDITFTPDETGDYIINILWSDLPLPHTPLRGLAVAGTLPVDHTKVILTGKGLREAYAGQRCEFIIDGSQAGQGVPRVVLKNSQLQEMHISCEAIGFNRYRCLYTAPAAGEYLLYVSWSDRELRDSPFRVLVTQSSASEASRVAFNKSLTKSGLVNQSFTAMIDTQLAGPGELVARCAGPSKSALCELIEQGDGQYLLSVKPREIGQHVLEVTYAGQHIAGSPHAFTVGSPPDPSKVRVVGPGVEDGVLSTFQSHFFVHTQGAGAGSLSVRVRGPKGGFNVAMRRPTAGERTIECSFNPTEVGLYIVTVRWSDVDVPGSPFYVHIFDTPHELERFVHYGMLPGNRREFTYLSGAMSASEPMLNTLASEQHQQQYRTGHHGYRAGTTTRTRQHHATSTMHRPVSSLMYR